VRSAVPCVRPKLDSAATSLSHTNEASLRSISCSTRPVPSLLSGAIIGLLLCSAPVRAQTQAERASLIAEARKAQSEFERYRASRIPVERERTRAVCDERIGGICIWYGGEDELRFPAERPEVFDARDKLIRLLSTTSERVKDRWVIGQLVHYLVENRVFGEAERVATACGIEETWWCSALRGYSLHVRSQHVEAEAAFREALAAMPEPERARWTSLRYILTPDGEKYFERLDPAERTRRWELFWRLSDPLFLINGNDRLNDHFARLVEATSWRDAAHPQGEWGDDQEAALIRYGRNIGYSRTMDAPTFGSIQDTRRVVGHHHPKSRGYLFPEAFLASPWDIPPESWITAPREARTWYAPLYAPDMRALDTQVGRFRRGDDMLVVGAYTPRLAPADSTEANATRESCNGADIHGAFFLIPEDGTPPKFSRNNACTGVFELRARPGRYVTGLEVVDVKARRAWRARQGIGQLPLVAGNLDVSDFVILKAGAPLPATLEEAIPDIRPGVTIRRGERFPVVWEAYGLRVQEPVRVTLGFTRGRPGFLARVGAFLGVIETARPVEVAFQDAGPDGIQTAFRALEIELPALDSGEYTLHLRLEIAGRDPVTVSRPIIVER
jgi:hypothetical protein